MSLDDLQSKAAAIDQICKSFLDIAKDFSEELFAYLKVLTDSEIDEYSGRIRDFFDFLLKFESFLVNLRFQFKKDFVNPIKNLNKEALDLTTVSNININNSTIKFNPTIASSQLKLNETETKPVCGNRNPPPPATHSSISNELEITPEVTRALEKSIICKDTTIVPELNSTNHIQDEDKREELHSQLQTINEISQSFNNEPESNSAYEVALQASYIPRQISISMNHYNIYVTSVVSPTLYWASLDSTCADLMILNKNLNKFYNKNASIEKYFIRKPVRNLICAARFSVDSIWYRAKIINIEGSNNKVEVIYVDYGNKEWLPASELRLLDSSFVSTPTFAIPFSSANIIPNNSKSWDDKSIDKFKKIVMNPSPSLPNGFHAKVLFKRSWPVYFCQLSDSNNNNVLKKMTDGGYAQSARLEDVMSIFKKDIELECKYLCINVKPKEANISTTSSILTTTTPSDLSAVNKQTNTSLDRISVLSSVAHELNNKTLKADELKFYKCRVTYIVNPHEFYIELIDDDSQKYEQMQSDLNSFYGRNAEKIKQIMANVDELYRVKHPCVVKDKNKAFKRAVILRRPDNDENQTHSKMYSVKFVDSGVCKIVYDSLIYPLVDEFNKLPPLALLCELNFIKPIDEDGMSIPNNAWEKDAIAYFKDCINQIPKLVCRFSNLFHLPISDSCSYIYKFDTRLKVILLNEAKQTNLGIIDDLVRNGFVKFTSYGESERKACRPPDDTKEEDNKVKMIIRYIDQQYDVVTRIKSGEPCHEYLVQEYFEDLESKQNGIENDNKREFVSDSSKSENNKKDDAINIQTTMRSSITNINDDTLALSHQVPQSYQVPRGETPKQDPMKFDEFVSKFKELYTYEARNELKSSNANEVPDDWHPMKDDFESKRNVYTYDDENVESVLFGFEMKDNEDLCRQFRRTGECKRKNCPFLHLNKNPIIVNKVPEGFYLEAGDVAIVEITSIISPINYLVRIVSFYRQQINKFKKITNLKILTEKMNNYYKKNREKHKSLMPFNIAQSVAVYDRETDCWFRAKVSEVFYEESPDFCEYLVDYIDIGRNATLRQNELFTLDEKFTYFDPEISIINLCETKLNAGVCIKSAKSKINDLLKNSEQRSHAQIVCKDVDSCEVILVLTNKHTKEKIVLNEYVNNLNA